MSVTHTVPTFAKYSFTVVKLKVNVPLEKLHFILNYSTPLPHNQSFPPYFSPPMDKAYAFPMA
jgi:hypothetical protein